MPRTRGPYPPEFKARMVELVKAGRSPEQLAKEFEPSANAEPVNDNGTLYGIN